MAGTESGIVPTSGTNTNTNTNITAKRPRVEETDQNRGLASVSNSDQPLDQVLSSLRSSIGDGRMVQILQGIERIVQVPSHVSRLSGLIPPSLPPPLSSSCHFKNCWLWSRSVVEWVTMLV